MVRFGSIRISGPLSVEHISDVGSGMGPGCLVRVLDFGSVSPGLNLPILTYFNIFQPISTHFNKKIPISTDFN